MSDEKKPQMRLIKWGSKVCPACSHMERSRILENFKATHPDVVIIKLDVADEEGETPKGSEYDRNMKLSDDYGVDSLPTLVFESMTGGELASWEGGIPVKELEKLHKAALARLEAAQQIPMPKG